MAMLLQNLGVVWPSLLMGAIIPAAVLLILFLSKRRKEVSIASIGFGVATFFASLVSVAVLLLMSYRLFFSTVVFTSQSDADRYIYIGGTIVLLLFYVIAEALKMISFHYTKKAEGKNYRAGLTFGCGFILAQNLLIFGLIYMGGMDIKQSLGFGVLMLLSGAIYILNAAVGYRLYCEKQKIAAAAIAFSYYLMFIVMILFANVYITYSFVAVALIFNIIVARILYPSLFRIGGEK